MSGEPPDAGETEVDPLVGRTIGGKFVIERLLGAGAMGAVYRAEQTALDRTVAIKVMHSELARDPTYAARFHREAKAVSKLDHPNLIRILDYGQEADGLLYIAMEFLDGRDLFTAIEEEWPLTHERMVDILSQALSALAEAHDAGVLHRDLKPENIMLLRKKGEDGASVDAVKVCDFGIAKVAEEPEVKTPGRSGGRNLTAAGLVVGTPGYMSPEQARSEPCDARSDIYAVGVILYQLLTRRLPFEGNTPLDIVVKALHEAPPPLGSHGPTAAPGLEAVCMQAMNKKPEDRYPSAREMRAALRAAPVLRRHVVLGAPDRPSIVNAPTQLELPGSSASTGARAMPPATQAARFWRAGGLLAGVAIAGLALFTVMRPRRLAPEVSTASQLASAVAVPGVPAAPPIASAAPANTAAAVPSAVVATAPTAGVALSPAAPASVLPAARPTSHRPRESTTIAPDPAPPPVAAAPVPAAPTVEPPPATLAVASPPVAAPVAPPPAAPAPTPERAAPTFNLGTARVEIGQARTNNAAATGGAVSRAIGPFAARFTNCYRAALAQASTAHETPATLHLESDDQGYVTSAHVSGPAPADAARCIEGLVTHGARIEVDTGNANADVSLTFRPL